MVVDQVMTNLSLVMPTYNKLPRLSLVLASLSRQTYPTHQWEVVIVDDGSTDATSAYLDTFTPPFTLRRLCADRTGRSAARNRGLAHANFDVIVFLDDDVLLPPEFVAAHAAEQQNAPAVVHGRIVDLTALKFFDDPSKGIFYPEFNSRSRSSSLLREACLTEQDVVEQFDRKVRTEQRTTAFESVIETVLTGRAPGPPWIGFTGGNVAVPKAWLMDAGRFDESFGLDWGCEDLELGYRLWLAGHPFRYSHACVNYHLAHYRFRFDAEQARTSSYFARKHDDGDIEILGEFIAGALSGKTLLERFRERRASGAASDDHAGAADQ